MANQTLEQRVTALETEVRDLRGRFADGDEQPWWRSIIGIFKNDPDFKEAMRLGREYRVSQRDQSNESKE